MVEKDEKNFSEYAILINGRSLSLVFGDETLSNKINCLFEKADSVIVFRSSPNEKAQIVKFVMRNNPEAFTLAIGDGANDVNMIQTASIGIGIMGKEGGQAAAFSDYAIPNFKSLRRLIFWHGRQIGVKMIPYFCLCLFKHQFFMVHQLYTNFTNGYSAFQIYANFYFSLFDVLNTFLAVAFFLLVD